TFAQRRDLTLAALFVTYIVTCLAVPVAFYDKLDCEEGLPWEIHFIFLSVFLLTKGCELYFYRTDPGLSGPLPVFTPGSLFGITGGFAFKFTMSFMAYFDGYQDALATATAFRCEHPVSQELAPYMMGYFMIGVVALQWGFVAYLALQDPTRGCAYKLLHMETVCARLTLPPSHKKTWVLIQAARTVGEDIPQSLTQGLFVYLVKGKPFMILSICCSVGSSLMAAKDALTRRLLASGDVQKQALLQAADEHVQSFYCSVSFADQMGISKVVVVTRSGRQSRLFGGREECDQALVLRTSEYITQVRVAHHGQVVWCHHLQAIEVTTSENRTRFFGRQVPSFDFVRRADEGKQIVSLQTKVDRNGVRILDIVQAKIPLMLTRKNPEPSE
ncbi:unnamed protein product, partial [Symbiodinium pilosum]